MLVNFNSMNRSANLQATTFKGAREDIEKALLQLTELENNDILDLSAKNERKINILNGVAVPLKIKAGRVPGLDSLVLEAAKFTPEEDKRHSAARYGAEIYRLAEYGGGCSKQTMTNVDKILASKKTNAKFETTRRGFQTSRTNCLGIPISMDEALGVCRKRTYIRTNGKKDLNN